MSDVSAKGDFTQGSIVKKILLFALPVFLGALFQQLYNVVDSLVVGNFTGKEALASVSSSGSLIFLMVGFVHGLFMGSGVIIAKHYGAREEDVVHTAVHTTIAFALVMGVILTVVGIGITPALLRLMKTPEDVLPGSIAYFRLYFLGGIALVMYNATSGIFQAMGDSRHPLYYLVTASVINTILDLILVAGLGMGVRGAAIATVISQFTSATLSLRKLTKVDGVHRVTLSDVRLDRTMLGRILHIGIPTGIQNSVIAIANVTVQANINAFGSQAMAGCGAYFRLEGFAFLPITSFSAALTSFVSQNLGARKYDRVRKGTSFGLFAGVIIAELIGLTLYTFAPGLIALFNDEAEVIATGVLQARTESLFYCLLALTHCMAGILRGAGKTKVPMIVMLVCWCLIRITYITVAVHFFPVIQTVFWAYPITWSLSSIIFVIYYFAADWIHAFEVPQRA